MLVDGAIYGNKLLHIYRAYTSAAIWDSQTTVSSLIRSEWLLATCSDYWKNTEVKNKQTTVESGNQK